MTEVVPPGKGHRFKRHHAAAQSSGDFSLMERTLPPGSRMPPAHRHTNCSEAFFVLEGEITFVLGSEQLTGRPGDFLLVPRGQAHTFGNRSEREARLLVLHAPAADAYFEELHDLWADGRTPERDEEIALMRRHGMEPA